MIASTMSPAPDVRDVNDREPQDESRFERPWQARVFSLLICLIDAAHVSWPEWADSFAADLARDAAAAESGSCAYFRCWYEALRGLLLRKGLVDEACLAQELAAILSDHPHHANSPAGKAEG